MTQGWMYLLYSQSCNNYSFIHNKFTFKMYKDLLLYTPIPDDSCIPVFALAEKLRNIDYNAYQFVRI